MKFYNVSLIAIIATLLISAGAVVIGVSYALDISDRENNAYYSELSYHLAEQQFTKHFEYIENNLFYSSNYNELRNKMFYALSDRQSKNSINLMLENMASQNELTNYYYQTSDGSIFSNSDDALVDYMLDELSEDAIVQHILFSYEGTAYIGFVKSMTSEYVDGEEFLIFYTPFDNLISATTLNDFLNSNGFISITFVGDYNPETEKSLSFMPFETGYIDISNDEYNVFYISGQIDNATSVVTANNPQGVAEIVYDDNAITEVMNQAIEVKVQKPGIIDSITRRISLIIVTILVSFIFFAVIMLYLLKRVSMNLETVVKKINRIARGEYNSTIVMKGIEEFEVISESINMMAATIDEKINELSNKNEEILKIMVEALEATDVYTKGHSDRVARYTYILAQKMNYENIDELMSAALLHDIGKIAVPEHILNKPGKLDDDEYNKIKEHVDAGYRILSKSSTFDGIEELVHCHHERIDGKGYPRGIKGDEIPLGAQIISICDVYDALTSNRPYRTAMAHEKAIRIIIEEKGKQFASEIVDQFLTIDFQMI